MSKTKTKSNLLSFPTVSASTTGLVVPTRDRIIATFIQTQSVDTAAARLGIGTRHVSAVLLPLVRDAVRMARDQRRDFAAKVAA